MQVFANGPLWRAARNAWQTFFKQASLGGWLCTATLCCDRTTAMPAALLATC